jgi:hypothetical protein
MRSKLSSIEKTWKQVREADLGCAHAFYKLKYRADTTMDPRMGHPIDLCAIDRISPSIICTTDCVFSAMVSDDNLMQKTINELTEIVGQ